MRQVDRLGGPAAGRPDPSLISDVQCALALSPRQLPSRLLYDELGSALFDAICRLPWYHVTRSEQQLLARHAKDIVEAAGRPGRLIELGAGNGDKLATLIELGWPAAPRLSVELVDVSPAALQSSRQRLSLFDHVDLVTWPLSFEQALGELSGGQGASTRTMVLFLGSNIGNFDPPDAEMFLHQLRSVTGRGDTLLLGTDLIKAEDALLAAYDDPLGVTAAFNRNLLVRLNRELRADFAVPRFSHAARWDGDTSRIEMHLVSDCRQDIRILDADVAFTMEAGETIWTERSYKYDAAAVLGQLRACGFDPLQQWIDAAAGFALTLAKSGGC